MAALDPLFIDGSKMSKELTKNFLWFLKNMKNLKKKTVDEYERTIRELCKFTGKTVLKMKIEDVYGFIQDLRQRKAGKSSKYYYLNNERWYSEGTLKTKTGHLKKFFEWVNSSGYNNVNAGLIALPRITRNKIESIDERKVRLLLEAPREFEERKDMMYRNMIFMQLGYYMGLRISEACAITFDEIESGYYRILGKKGRKRTLPIPFIIKETARQFREIRWGIVQYTETIHYKNRAPAVRTRRVEDRNPNLVISCLDSAKYGKEVDPKNIGAVIFRRYEMFLWLQERVTFHMLRHSFWTHLLQSGVSIKVVQEMMGHASINSTEKHIDVSQQQMKKAQMRIIPMTAKQNIKKLREEPFEVKNIDKCQLFYRQFMNR